MRYLVMIAAILALAPAPLQAAPKHKHYAKTKHHMHHERRSIDGDLIDAQGWRYRSGGWDNTCFRTLDWLSSASACSGAAG